MSSDPFAGAYLDEIEVKEKEDPFAGAYLVEEEEVTPPEEDWLQTVNRYLGQIPAAGISIATWPGALTTQLGKGEAQTELEELEERLPRLQKLFSSAPWENFAGLNRENYLKNIELAS